VKDAGGRNSATKVELNVDSLRHSHAEANLVGYTNTHAKEKRCF
jgi:hypothetical protein